MPDLIVDIQHISDSPTSPDDEEIASWVSSALTHHPDNITSAELSVRIVDDTEMAALNENYRSKQGPTNVMSFPFEPPPGFPEDDAHPLLATTERLTPAPGSGSFAVPDRRGLFEAFRTPAIAPYGGGGSM